MFVEDAIKRGHGKVKEDNEWKVEIKKKGPSRSERKARDLGVGQGKVTKDDETG